MMRLDCRLDPQVVRVPRHLLPRAPHFGHSPVSANFKHTIKDWNVLYYFFVTRSCFLRHLQTALAAAMLSTTNVIVTKLRDFLVFLISVAAY
jgi:hypothetical protein